MSFDGPYRGVGGGGGVTPILYDMVWYGNLHTVNLLRKDYKMIKDQIIIPNQTN